jgi:hypothetical protein
VSVKKVNILSVELNEPLDEAGFRHVASSVGPPLGAQRIGASEPAGERILTPGDLVCFPSGHLGAHTLNGPGRRSLADPNGLGRDEVAVRELLPR